MGIYRRILRLATAALLAVPGLLHAQTRQISGTVTRSGGGAPIGEATVSITGTTASARTDAQGKFTLTAPLVDVRLTVRAIGFSRKDVMVSAATTTVSIVLDQDVFKLEEVVVSGQATTVQRRNLTTAVGFVSGEDITKVASPTIEPHAPLSATAHHLLDGTDAAIARQTLLQVASLPDRIDKMKIVVPRRLHLLAPT